MQHFLYDRFTIIDINHESILDRYATIDAYRPLPRMTKPLHRPQRG